MSSLTSVAESSNKAASRNSGRQLLQRQCRCGAKTGSVSGNCETCNKKRLQTKLSVGASNDPLEHEADRIADQVLKLPSHPAVATAPISIQRAGSGAAGEAGMAAPASVDHALAGSGKSLEPTLRQDMEQRFGHDFSQVRIHSDTASEQSAREINASAYTTGNNVVFGSGRYTPETQTGRQLLAHELTHVVQQSAGSAANIQREIDDESEDPDTTETGDMDSDTSNTVDNDESETEEGEDSEEVSFGEEPEALDNKSQSKGDKKIRVELPGTLVRLEGSKEISRWNVSSGKPGHETPKGSFSIYDRDEGHRSSSYGKCDGKKIGPDGKSKCKGKYVGADMHYYQEFSSQVGFHRGSPSVMSHGCIHVADAKAKKLWGWSDIGTPVEVRAGSVKKKSKSSKKKSKSSKEKH